MRYHTKSSQSQSFFALHLTSSMPWRNLLYNTLFNFLYISWSFLFTLVFPTPSIHSLHMSRENKSKKATCQLYWKMLAKVRHWHISTCDFLEYWISNQIRSSLTIWCVTLEVKVFSLSHVVHTAKTNSFFCFQCQTTIWKVKSFSE